MWLFHVENHKYHKQQSGKKSVARSLYPCGEINVSEKTVAKSCVVKLSVAKSMYTIKEQSVISYRPHSGLIYMQGTSECIIRHMKTLQVNGEHLQH